MTTSSQDKKKILIVEDEHELRELYVQIIDMEGYAVDSAADGDEAYQKISANPYDLILLDIILPKRDGLQVLDQLKQENRLPKNNVILLTNLGQDLVVAKALEYNVRGYLVKSDYTPDQLLKEIKEFLEDPDKS